jgi:3-methyladenine DNA glycosylase/8-oxoguanine DNA glycosylase
MGQYELNRKMYKDIRKMDHGQMDAFCKSLYKSGYELGKKEAEGLSESEIRAAILSVKGIGEKKADDIMQAIISADKEKGDQNE